MSSTRTTALVTTQRHDPPIPRAFPLFGHLAKLSAGEGGCLYDALHKLADVHGDIFRLNIMGRPWIVLSDGDLIREVLVRRADRYPKGSTWDEIRAVGIGSEGLSEVDGERWERQRRLTQPAFRVEILKGMMAAFNDKSRQTIALVERHHEVEMLELLSRTALAVISQVAFGYRSPGLDDIDAADPVLERQHYGSEQVMKRLQRTPLWKYLPIPSNFKLKRIVRDHQRFFLDRLEERRRTPGAHGDLLTLLLAEKDEQGRAGFSDTELVDQMQNFLGAAHESVGAVMHWLFHYLALDPALDARVHAEVRAVLGDAPDVRHEHLAALPLLGNTISETLRLRPAFPLIMRESSQRDVLGGYTIDAGAWIVPLIARLQTNPAIWGDTAHLFDPSRFDRLTPEQAAALISFGLGPRVCIGKRMAEFEMTVIAAQLVRRFRFELVPGQNLRPFMRFAWMSKNGLRMRAIPRARS